MNKQIAPSYSLTNFQQRESINVHIKLFKLVLVSNGENLIILFLDFFDIAILLNSFQILLFPVTQCFNLALL